MKLVLLYCGVSALIILMALFFPHAAARVGPLGAVLLFYVNIVVLAALFWKK
jgi:hypothetical protein